MTLLGTVSSGDSGATFKVVTLTTGTLPSWDGALSTLVGAQVCSTHTPAFATIATVTDSTHFTVSTDIGAAHSGERFYIAKPWTAAQNNSFYRGCSAKPPIAGTTGLGYFGSDGAASIDLAPAGVARVLWLFADTYWNPGGVSRPGCSFIHGSVAIQTATAYDLSTDVFGVFAAAGPASFWPELGPNNYHWGLGGICVNPNVLLVVAQMVQAGGVAANFPRSTVFWVSNPTAADPTTWNIVPIPNPFAEMWPGCYVDQWADPGDGYLYTSGYGNSTNSIAKGQDRSIYLCRFPKADVNVAAGVTPSLARPQWWCGPLGWIATNPYDPNVSVRQLMVPIVVAGATLPDSKGALWKKNDGSWARALTNAFPYGPIYAFSGLITDQGLGDVIYRPAQNAHANLFVYGVSAHPEQTWSGKATDDILLSYDTNLFANSVSVTANVPSNGTLMNITSGALPSWVVAGEVVSNLLGANTTIATVNSPTQITLAATQLAGNYSPKITDAFANTGVDASSYWPQLIRVAGV